jgi:hypothetical protein
MNNRVLFIVAIILSFQHWRRKSAAITAQNQAALATKINNESSSGEALSEAYIVEQVGAPVYVTSAPPPQYVSMQYPITQNTVSPMMHQAQPTYSVQPQSTITPVQSHVHYQQPFVSQFPTPITPHPTGPPPQSFTPVQKPQQYQQHQQYHQQSHEMMAEDVQRPVEVWGMPNQRGFNAPNPPPK